MKCKNRKRQIHPCGAAALAAVLVLGASVVAPSEAQAEWLFGQYDHTGNLDEFSFTCSPENLSGPGDLLPPAALLMFDRSISMGPGTEWNDLWDLSVQAVKDAVNILSDEMMIGLGYFSDSNYDPYQINDPYNGFDANFVVPFQYDAFSAVETSLDATGPYGTTPTDDAVAVIREVILDRPDLAAGGVLITDGAPGNNSSSVMENTLIESCASRSANILNYVVGIGTTINKDYNDVQAAALGTGSCTGSDPCIDPSGSIGRTDCDGSYQVYDEVGLKNLLMEIGNKISCTFPIENEAIAQWSDGVPDDPEAVKVKKYGSSFVGGETIEHESVNGSGWFFTTNSRTHITLTPDLCADFDSGSSDQIDQIGTQAACDCNAIIEEHPHCLVPQTVNAACPAKEFVCNGNIPECTGDAVPQGDDCPWENCPPLDPPELCHVDNEALVKVRGANVTWDGSDGPGDLDRERNRCQMGVLTCNALDGAECLPLSPMPELCDGLDNNCDGLVDNMSTGWEQVTDAGYPHDDSHIPMMSIPPEAEYPGAACYEEDVCGCSDGQWGEHGGLQAVLDGADLDAEFAEYLSDWIPETDGGCGCVPSLSR